MDLVQAIIQGLYDAPISTSIRESEWTFPVIQTFHILGILIFYGAISLVDLRFVGIVLKQRPAREVAAALLPVAWVGFAIMLVSGGLLFAAQAAKIYSNAFLLAKFGLIVLAGFNLVAFHFFAGRQLAAWGAEGGVTPTGARLSAGLSFLLWTGVIVTGRFIAYF
jgi:hypothetical protein